MSERILSMELFGSSGPERQPGRRLTLIGVAVIVMIVAAAGLTIWDLRREAIEASTQEIQNLGVAFAEQTSRTLQAVDLVLNEASERISRLGLATSPQFEEQLGSEEWHQFLVDRLKKLPQAEALSLVGADGKVINSSRRRPFAATDPSEAGFVEYFRLHKEATSYLSTPAKSRANGAWRIFVARRINSPAGEYLGTVVTTLQTDYLNAFSKAVTLRENGLVSEGAALTNWRRQATFIAIGALCAALGFIVLFRALGAKFRELEHNRTNLETKTFELQQTADALRESEHRLTVNRNFSRRRSSIWIRASWWSTPTAWCRCATAAPSRSWSFPQG
jgi:hypothetical protein